MAMGARFPEHLSRLAPHATETDGGIQVKFTRPAEILYDNLIIHPTLFRTACQRYVEKLRRRFATLCTPRPNWNTI